MSEDLELIREAERKRYKLLYETWKATRGGTQGSFDANDLIKNGLMKDPGLSLAYRYLRDEGLVEDSYPQLSLTHEGLVEIERSVKHPEQETKHFSAVVIQHFNAPVGIVQTGPESTGNIVNNKSASS